METDHTAVPEDVLSLDRSALPPINTVSDANLSEHLPLDNGRHTTQPPQHPVGVLDAKLPTEIIQEIVLGLDVPSLTTFRRVNRRAMELVDSVHEYAMIYKHCPDVLRAVLALEARAYDLRWLFQSLCSRYCVCCNSTWRRDYEPKMEAGFMYLIRGVRLCYTCITGDPLYIPMLVDDMDVGRKWYAKHTSVVGVPGVYSPVPVAMEARAVLVDRFAVKASGWPEGLDWRGSLFWPEADDRFSRDPVRFMAVAEVPYLSFRGREAAWGRLCAQCVDLVSGGPPNFLCYDRFTEEGLQKHLDLEHI